MADGRELFAPAEMAADFEQTVNALTVAAGSAKVAREELTLIAEVSRNTTGLRLVEAETLLEQSFKVPTLSPQAA